MARWFEGRNFLWLSPVPLLALLVGFWLWHAALEEGRDARPFLLTLALFALGFAGLVLGMWPNLVPPSLSIWEAASPHTVCLPDDHGSSRPGNHSAVDPTTSSAAGAATAKGNRSTDSPSATGPTQTPRRSVRIPAPRSNPQWTHCASGD